jgi:Kef-type K+ transport system membrane component KefB
MQEHSIIFWFFLIFAGAALCATVALYARQAMLLAYIVVGLLLGPFGAGMVSDAELIQSIGSIGIMFLLYLLGLNMVPERLMAMLGEALGVTLISSLVFMLIGVAIAAAFGLGWPESLLIGVAMMFSSTIIGLKLLPTTALHHRHTGQVIISILLIQDLIAIVVLLLLTGYGKGGGLSLDIGIQLFYLPLLVGVAYVIERFVLVRLIARFDQIHEYIFLLAIGWCLGMAEFAATLGLSHEIGAFIAGVALASSPIALFIADHLRPLRDFFLILFFFAIGAGFDLSLLDDVWMPASALALAALLTKPWLFRRLLMKAHEKTPLARETGVRLGQISEFSLLIGVMGVQTGFISAEGNYIIQMATLLSFAASSFWIVQKLPTPIAVSDQLRRD